MGNRTNQMVNVIIQKMSNRINSARRLAEKLEKAAEIEEEKEALRVLMAAFAAELSDDDSLNGNFPADGLPNGPENHEHQQQQNQAVGIHPEYGEFEVIGITDKWIKNGIVHYLTHWDGIPNPTWSEVHNLANAMALVLEWERSKEGKYWSPVLPSDVGEAAKMRKALKEEYERLAGGGYRVVENLGKANNQTWLRMLPIWNPNFLEMVLILKNDDPFIGRVTDAEKSIIEGNGTY